MDAALIEKAKKIRLVISDVDGVLTTGALFYTASGSEIKAFNVHDGLGMKMLQQSGIQLAIITARRSAAVTQRMQDLKIEHVYQGQSDKLLAYEELKQKLQLTDSEIAYIGDDLPDLSILTRVGFSATVADAPNIIQEHVAFITNARSGKGAMREFCDIILKAQGTYDAIVDTYLRKSS